MESVPGQDPYYVQYCRVNFDGTGLTVLTEGDGNHSASFSPDYRFLVDTWSRVDQPPVSELRSAEDGHLICPLEKADATALFASGWKPPERFVAKGRDGVTDIYGIIYRPMNFDPGKKYPVIEEIYAGPQDSYVPKSFRASYRYEDLASRGFIIVQIDGMGTSNRSKKFHDVCYKNLVDAGLPDRILWIKAAAAKYPYLDLDRVGIYGGSAGGQSALGALLTHGDFYKAAAADCGCHDNRMDKIWWNEQWMGWPVGPWYEAQSNVTLAHNLKGKLLLTVGELDRNVDPSSTMQVVNALIKANKDFEFIIFPGGGHGSGGSPYGNRRRIDFFVRAFLGRNEAPRTSSPAGAWEKYSGNPVLGGHYGTCFDLSVLKENDAYRLWFSWRPKASIALVQSPDGIHWSEPVIVLGPNRASGWENDVNRPVVIKQGDTYHMWYTGQSEGHSSIGYATSPDGVVWKRLSAKPVLAPDQPWEKVALMCPDVLWDAQSKLYRMWYSGGEQYEPDAIGYATSPDGMTWTKSENNPVFKSDPNLEWEHYKVTACQVVEDRGWYLMFYIGFRDVDHAQIGVARSPDGVTNWQRLPTNPIIRPGLNQWDHDACYKPYAIFDGAKWLLWYNGRHGGSEQIGLATHDGEDLGF